MDGYRLAVRFGISGSSVEGTRLRDGRHVYSHHRASARRLAFRGCSAGGRRAVVRVERVALQVRPACGGRGGRGGGDGVDDARGEKFHGNGARQMKYSLLILGMAVITYAIRSAVFVFGERLSFPPLVRTALNVFPVTLVTVTIM